MSALTAFILLASVHAGSTLERDRPFNAALTHPALVETQTDPNGLTLYNAKGEAVARCARKDEAFTNCRIEPGYTLDDLMNAWANAYSDLSK